MSTLEYKLVTASNLYDCVWILDNLRQADKAEIRDLGGSVQEVKAQTLEVLADSIHRPTEEAYIIYQKGFPVSLFGNNEGVVWLLATEKLKASISYTKIAKRFLNEWSSEHPLLWNYVSNKNLKTLKWLKHLGCELTDYGNLTKFEYK